MRSITKSQLVAFGMGLILLITVPGCEDPKRVQSVGETTNVDYKVDFLFEHQGVRMYRFADKGNWIYYTNPSSSTTNVHTVDDGEGGSHIETIRVMSAK